MQIETTRRHRFQLLRAQLMNARSGFESHWRDLSNYIFPRRQRFFVTETSRPIRRNYEIIDSTATLAARTLRSGMMGGVTSPARPWFRLTTPDPDMMEIQDVKEWLHIVTDRMATVFLRSNLYNCLPTTYGDLGAFGTAAMLIEEDFEDVVRFYPFPIGSYWLSNNKKLQVNVFMRDFRLTVRQLVEKFGNFKPDGSITDWSNFSLNVKSLYENHLLDTWVDVTHVVEPNQDYDPSKPHSKHKKFSSCYYETGTNAGTQAAYVTQDLLDQNAVLRESGVDYFPVLAPRWELTAEDVYGTNCPGMESLGDIRQLQLGEKRRMQAIEKMVNPPMVGTPDLRNQKTTILPGDITYLASNQGAFKPAHEVNFRIEELNRSQQEIRQRISRSFYEDLFLMLANSDRRQITATEIDERKEEKLLALGPVLEQLNQDLLDPLIDITFSIMHEQGLIPPAPAQLQRLPLRVEYTSVMAQAQKMVGIAAVDRFTQYAGSVAEFDPKVLDKVNTDELIDVYGEVTGINPKIIRSDDEVKKMRTDRANQQAAQQKMEMLNQGSQAVKNLATAGGGGGNTLSQGLPFGSPQQSKPQSL